MQLTAFRKYLLVQLPGWLLAALIAVGLWDWFGLPPLLVAALLALYVAKDFVLYPLLRRAYEPSQSKLHEMVGAEAIVSQPLAPRGYVRVRGELWRAEAEAGIERIDADTVVRVRAVRGLTLVVIPESRERKA